MRVIFTTPQRICSAGLNAISANNAVPSFRPPAAGRELNQVQLLDAINSWESSRLIVLGDTIVDQYAACEAIGMSAEAPVVVVRELKHKNFIGGAAVVAAHISALGARCDFISVVGSDSTAELVRQELAGSRHR